jgi:uncharacterized Zn finger protein
MSSTEAPGAITVLCPDCEEETLHDVLRGRMSQGGATTTLDATVQCTQCQRVHQVLVKEAAPIEVAIVVSQGESSTRAKVKLPGDEEISLGEALIVDGENCKLTGIEDKTGRRVDDAAVKDVRTLWAKKMEELPVKFAINLGHKTITKVIPSRAEEEFTVGAEHVFGRLRVTVHAIKTEERLLKRGSAEAAEIVRVFARPTPLGEKAHRPDKKSREQLRLREERRGDRA